MKVSLARLVPFVALLGAWACDSLLVDPQPADGEPSVQFAFSGALAASAYGDMTAVLEQVRIVQFRFTRDGASRDTAVWVRAEDGQLEARVQLHDEEAMGWLEVEAVLALEYGQALFRAHSVVQGLAASPLLRAELEPVIDRLEMSTPAPFTALGDTAEVTVSAQFATGDPLVGVVFEWSSDDASVAEVVGEGTIVSRGNGATSVVAAALGVEGRRPAIVAQVPASLTGVAPSDTTISVGESFRMRPFGQDANGFPLLPGAALDWNASGSVAVDSLGTVIGQTTGPGSLEATFGPVSHAAQVAVTP